MLDEYTSVDLHPTQVMELCPETLFREKTATVDEFSISNESGSTLYYKFDRNEGQWFRRIHYRDTWAWIEIGKESEEANLLSDAYHPPGLRRAMVFLNPDFDWAKMPNHIYFLMLGRLGEVGFVISDTSNLLKPDSDRRKIIGDASTSRLKIKAATVGATYRGKFCKHEEVAADAPLVEKFCWLSW